MIPVLVRDPEGGSKPARTTRRRFGLDAPLPADPRVIERAILRHIAASRRSVEVLALGRQPAPEIARSSSGPVRLAAGVPDLLLLLPGGRVAFLTIKTQAKDLSRAQRAFEDVCRERGIPVHVVRSLPEARQALDRLGIPVIPEDHHACEEGGVARRYQTREKRP